MRGHLHNPEQVAPQRIRHAVIPSLFAIRNHEQSFRLNKQSQSMPLLTFSLAARSSPDNGFPNLTSATISLSQSSFTWTVFWTRHSCHLRTVAKHFIIRFYQAGNVFHAPSTERCRHRVAKHRPGRGDGEQDYAVTVNKTIRSTRF